MVRAELKRKRKLSELAVLGGRPMFDGLVHVGRPNLGDQEHFLDLARGIWDRCWLTNDGPVVRAFEEQVADLVGVRHCIAVCNATLGLELLLQALGLEGEVIVPSFTFVATAHAVQRVGLTPIFCDIDPATHCLDPSEVERKITDRTCAILAVHLWGRACAPEALQRLADRHDLVLLFDAAHAFACSHHGKRIGHFGVAEVFSFHATKFVNSFEGGVITTQDGDLAACLREARNFGFSGYDEVSRTGTNAKMSEISAAMGLTSLRAMDRIVEANRSNYEDYAQGLRGIRGLELARYDEAEDNNYQYVVVEVDDSAAPFDRDLVLRVLHAENILARRYFFPGCHRMSPYREDRELHGGIDEDLPATLGVADRVLQLPTGQSVHRSEIEAIVELLQLMVERGEELRARLGTTAA